MPNVSNDDTESRLIFEGPGPFDLPTAQGSYAESQGDAVTIGFRVQTDPSRAATVRIAVLNNQALQLAHQIANAAAKGIRQASAKNES